jgi:hypothetical protein
LNYDDTVEFVDIGIQRVKTDQIEKNLTDRKEMGIDPFNQGYEYKHSHYDKGSEDLFSGKISSSGLFN